MTFPAYPPLPDAWPIRSQAPTQAAFDAAAVDTFDFFEALSTWASGYATESQGLAAALVAANLPSLTGNANRAVIVNSAADGVTFSAPIHTLGGHRNKILNGQFEIWQRGTSFTATGYTADRWRLDEGSGASCTISRQAFTAGQTDVPGNPRHYLRFARGTAGTATSSLEQRIEGVETLSGQTATLTFWARASAATEIRAVFVQIFGTGGSPSANNFVGAAINNESVGTDWAKYSTTIEFPSIAGKTLGTNGNDYLWLRIQRDHNDSNPTADLDIANVSIVAGDATNEADPGSWRAPATEFALACRYYYRTVGTNIGVGRRNAATSGGEKDAFEIAFPARMRVDPTASVVVAPTYLNASAVTLTCSQDGCAGRCTATAAGEYRAYGGTYDFDAEL